MDPGATWPQVLDRVGTVGQVASATPLTLGEGPEAGARVLDVRTIEGLHATVLLDRGMDLGQAWYRGTPLAWIAPTAAAQPAAGASGDWRSSFHGGLLVTAGTQNVGEPCEADGLSHPLHGALSSIPASDVRWSVAAGLSSEVVVEGAVREIGALGVEVELRRRLRFSIGRPRLVLEDAVTNLADRAATLMLLYHVNLGWPVVDAGSRLFGWPETVRPRAGDEAAAAALGEHDRFVAPTEGWPSQVFEHVDEQAPQSRTVGVVNPAYEATDGLAVALTYRPAELPRLWRWRMLGRGTYLTAIEPANCSLGGRAAAVHGREDLVTLAPGDTRQFTIGFEVGTGPSARRMAVDDRDLRDP